MNLEKHISIPVLAALAVFTLSVSATAYPIRNFQFQGFLTDDGGTPINGEKQVKVSIYSTEDGTTALWTETQTLEVSDGRFDMLLGSESPMDSEVFDGSRRWIGITVDSDAEMAPRQPVAWVPYAILASKANTADYAERSGSVEWSAIGSLPAGFADGIDDTMTADQVLALVAGADYVNADQLSIYATDQEIADALAGYAAVIHLHTLSDITDMPVCEDGKVLKHVGGSWNCGDDVDTNTTYDGTSFAVSLQSCPKGQFAIGIDDSGLLRCNQDRDSLDDIFCRNGEIPAFNEFNGAWECRNDIDTDTLAGITCSSGQMVGWDGSTWTCFNDSDTLASMDCAIGSIAKWNGSIWQCAADDNNTYNGNDFALAYQNCPPSMWAVGIDLNGALLCEPDRDSFASKTCLDGEILVFNQFLSVWECGPDQDRDTLAGLACSTGQVAKWNGSMWVCATDTDTTYTGSTFAKSNQSCSPGNVVTGVDASGNVTCVAASTGSGSSVADAVYGDGSDGNLVISTSTTWTESDFANMTKQYANITVNAAFSVPSGTLLRCNGTFTVGAGGSITVASGYANLGEQAYAKQPLALTIPTASSTYESQKLAASEAASINRAPALSGANGYVGTGGAVGGLGGGGFTIRAKGAVTLNGPIHADGGIGPDGIAGNGAGGGSGGFIIIFSQTGITNSSVIYARGGKGGAGTIPSGGTSRSGGGGGGGGIVRLVAPAVSSGSISVSGGLPGADYTGGATTIDGRSGGALGGNGGSGGTDGGPSGSGGTGVIMTTVVANPVNLIL